MVRGQTPAEMADAKGHKEIAHLLCVGVGHPTGALVAKLEAFGAVQHRGEGGESSNDQTPPGSRGVESMSLVPAQADRVTRKAEEVKGTSGFQDRTVGEPPESARSPTGGANGPETRSLSWGRAPQRLSWPVPLGRRCGRRKWSSSPWHPCDSPARPPPRLGCEVTPESAVDPEHQAAKEVVRVPIWHGWICKSTWVTRFPWSKLRWKKARRQITYVRAVQS